jgi:hypothetical protein
MFDMLTSADQKAKPRLFVISHVMHRAAFIAYPLAVIIYADRVKFDQNGAAFCAYADDGIEAITAECVFTAVFRMLPYRNIFCLIADMTRFHRCLPLT